MHRFNFLWASMFSLAFAAPAFAQEDAIISEAISDSAENDAVEPIQTDVVNTIEHNKHPRLDALKDLKNIKAENLKVDANAAQDDSIKDPLQPLNREVFAFNDMLDRNIARPLAVQYSEKVPGEVRGSYRLFRKNMSEPWNAVNQLAQGRFSRAAKSLGRFTINTVTSLGLADPASRLGLPTEEESLGMTLGYYGVPSGPYLMLPIMGPSSFRAALDYPVEGYAKPMTYILGDHDKTELAWGHTIMSAIDARSNLLDVDKVLQGDRYASIRDIYLQRVAFKIAEKKGNGEETVSFVDEQDDDSDVDSNSKK